MLNKNLVFQQAVKGRPQESHIKKLRQLGFKPPEPGGRHFYMRYGTYTFTLPSNKEYSVPQLRTLITELENGIGKKITLEEWEGL